MVKMSSVKEIILEESSEAELELISSFRAWMIRNKVSIIREGVDYFSFTNNVENSKDEILLSFEELAEVIGFTRIKID
jgi:hypothetical protein